MRIAIVNDIGMVAEGLRRIIVEARGHEVAWMARDGAEGVAQCAKDTPDLILMDLVMPVMDGVEATQRIMKETPCPILVVTSSVEANAHLVFAALGAGALDAISTPVLLSREGMEGKEALLAKISTIDKLTRRGRNKEEVPTYLRNREAPTPSGLLLAIGASSGGPAALADLLRGLPSNFPAAVIIVQHVDQQFAAELAKWLRQQTTLDVDIARRGEWPQTGRVLVAATNDHLVIAPGGKLDYTPMPRDFVYRPSVDVFFESVERNWSKNVIAVLLTGMGRDGAEGMLRLRNAGVHTIAQDQQSCAVYGMPKAAADLNAAVEILPLNKIAGQICQIFSNRLGRAV